MKKFFALAILYFCLRTNAQSAWSLQECISYAQSHNIALRQSAINNERNRNDAEQSKANLLPSLNAGAAHMYNFGKTIDRFTNTFANQQVLSQNFYLSSQVVLWSGWSQVNNMRAREFSYLSGVESLKQQEYDLALSVANAYIGAIFQEEILKIAQNQFEITREQLERTKKMAAAGSVAKSMEYDIMAQLANEELNVTTADNAYAIALLTLRQLMNLDSVSNFKIQRPEINMSENPLLQNNVMEMYDISLKTQPSIKSAHYQILSAERMLSVSKGQRSPTLTFNATLGTGTSGLAKDILDVRPVGIQTVGATGSGEFVYSPTFEVVTRTTPFANQFKNNANQSIGFQLNFPLFNGLQTHTAVKNAKLGEMSAKLSQDLAKQNLYKDIVQAYTNAKAALNRYNASKTSVEVAELSFKFAQQKFDAGAISAFEFNTSKNRLFTAESNLIQAKYDYVFKLKVLDYYQGKPLAF